MENTGLNQLHRSQVDQVLNAAKDLRDCMRDEAHAHKGFGWRMQVVAQAAERIADHVERLREIESVIANNLKPSRYDV